MSAINSSCKLQYAVKHDHEYKSLYVKVAADNRRSGESKPGTSVGGAGKQHEIHILGDNCYMFSKATKGVRLLGKAEECRARKGGMHGQI